jgi:hypothetical protein
MSTTRRGVLCVPLVLLLAALLLYPLAILIGQSLRGPGGPGSEITRSCSPSPHTAAHSFIPSS